MPSAPWAITDPPLAFVGPVGGGEIIVILIVALVVLGPQRLPEAAKSIGKAMGELRRASTGFQNELRSSIDEINSVDGDTAETARGNVLGKEHQATSTDGASTDGASTDDASTDDAVSEVSGQGSPPRDRQRPKRTRQLHAQPDPGDDGDGDRTAP
jgi:sec-independent protein translocase protein TatB